VSRSAQAYLNAESRIDRGRTLERRREQTEAFAGAAKATADGVLGGYSEDAQPDLARAVIREFSARLKSLSDGPAVASFLGEVSNALNADIPAPKASALKRANAAFKSEAKA
jgi:hypothetical protein